MDLSQPYRALKSQLDIEVLHVLFRTTRPLTGREVAVLAEKNSPSATHIALQRLVEHGLIYRQEAGKAFLYTLNREHLIFPAINCLFSIKTRFYDFLTNEFKTWDIPPIHVSLFGSMALGKGTTKSDIDLFIVRDSLNENAEEQWRNQIDNLCDQVFEQTGNQAGIAEIEQNSIDEFRKSGRPIVEKLKNTAITYYGIEITKLLTEDS